MKNQKGVTLVEMLFVIIVVFILAVWPTNFYRLTQCDFSMQKDWKCEIIHGIGVLIPPASFITVWFGTDN